MHVLQLTAKMWNTELAYESCSTPDVDTRCLVLLNVQNSVCSVTDRIRSNEHVIHHHHPVNCFCTKHVF